MNRTLVALAVLLAPYRGRRLAHLPRDPSSWPDPVYLDWHRRNEFDAS